MKDFSGMFKRIMAMLLAVIMLISSSNIGMVAHVFAQETDPAQEKVTLGQLIVSNYDQLNDKEETIIGSGYLAADRDIPYVKPTEKDDLVYVNKDDKRVFADPFTDSEGNEWLPVSFTLTDGEGNALDGNENLPFEPDALSYSGVYDTDAYTFVVNVTYQLHVDIEVAEQNEMLQAAEKLAADIAVLQHLDKVSIFEADTKGEYTKYENALKDQLGGLEVTAKLALQYLTMDVLENNTKSVVDMMYQWANGGQDIVVNGEEYTLEISGSANIAAAGNLYNQQEEGNGLDLYIFMDKTYEGKSYLEWLMEHGSELEESLRSNFDDIDQLSSDRRGLSDVLGTLEGLLEDTWESIEDTAADKGYTVTNMTQLESVLKEVAQKRADALAELNSALVGTDYERTIEDADDIQALIDDINADLKDAIDEANQKLAEAGRTEKVSDAASIKTLVAKIEAEIVDALKPLNDALTDAGYGKTVSKAADIDDAVAFLRSEIQKELDEQVNSKLDGTGYADVNSLEDLNNLIIEVETDLAEAIAGIGDALEGTKYAGRNMTTVADVEDLLKDVNADIATAVTEINDALKEAEREEDCIGNNKASVDALITKLTGEIETALNDVNADLSDEDKVETSEDVKELIDETEAQVANTLAPINAQLQAAGYTGTVKGTADVDAAVAYLEEKNDPSQATLIATLEAMKTNQTVLDAEANLAKLNEAYDTLVLAEDSLVLLNDLSSAMAKRDELTDGYNELKKIDDLLGQMKSGYDELAAIEEKLQTIEDKKGDLEDAESSIADLNAAYDKLAEAEELLADLAEAKDTLADADALIADLNTVKDKLQEAEDLLDQLNMLIAMMELTAATLEPVVEAFDDDAFNAESILKDGLTSEQYKKLTDAATGLTKDPETAKNPLFVTDAVVIYQMSMSDVDVEVIANVIAEDTIDSDVTTALETFKTKVTLEDGATSDQILEAIEEKLAENNPLDQEGWEEIRDNYDVTYSELPETLTGKITYTITYNPKMLSVELDGGQKSVPFGYNLTLPEHEDSKKEYVYTVANADDIVIKANLDQGTVWRVTENVTITRVEGAASEKQSINSLLVKTNTVSNKTEQNILLSGALKKDANISIALPNSNHLRSQMVDGVAQIIATEVNSRVGSLRWTVTEGYLDVESNTITFTDCVAETEKVFDLAYAKFFLSFSAEDLGKDKADLVAVMNIPYQLKVDYDAQKGAMDNLYAKQGTISMINDIDPVNGSMTVKGVLKMVADMGSLKEETRNAARELADSIPAGGSLPLVGTLEAYKNGGMTYYYTAEETIIGQIEDLHTALATMLDDQGFIDQVNSAKEGYVQKFIDARDLLAETLTALNSHPVNHNLVDVKSEALTGLLDDLDALTKKQYAEANVPASMTWIELVTTGAPGKSTITVSATYKGSQPETKSWTALTGSDIDASEIESVIAELATKLGVEHDHYTQSEVNIPVKLEGNLSIDVTWTANQYDVMVDDVKLGAVTIEGGTVKLPAHDEEYFEYQYDINGTIVAEGTDYTFTRAVVEALLKDGKVTIERTELDNTPEYTINIIVKAQVVSQTNDLTDVAPYSTYIILKLGESTDKVTAAGAEAMLKAKEQAGWEDVNDTYFEIKKSSLPGDKVEGEFTYTIEYTPKDVTFTAAGEEITMTYGSWYTLPSHADESMEYIYTVGNETYDQGQKVKINGELVITRIEQEASAKEYLTSLLIKAGKITDETIISILNSAALNKGKSIRIQLPDGSAITAEAVDGSVKITVKAVDSKIGDKQWVADKGYLDITPNVKFDFVENVHTVTGQDVIDFNKAFAIFELALDADALGVGSTDLLAALNLAHELKTDYTAQKAILDKLAAQQSTFAKMNDIDAQFELTEGNPLTFKGVLGMASTDLGVGQDAVNAAKELAELIPEEGVLPFATTLETYKNSTNGMLHFYQNAQKTYLPQINELYRIIQVLANDDGLMGLLNDSQKKMFTDALALLTEAETLNNENAIDYERIDVSSTALESLLVNIAKANTTEATAAPTELVLTEEVSVDAPGKFTVTIKVNYGDGKDESKTFMVNSALTDEYVNEVIERLEKELNVPVDYYNRTVSDYDETVTESVTINVDYTLKKYKVVVEDKNGTTEIGTVDYIDSYLDLPVNELHVNDKYPEGWYYTYTIEGNPVQVKKDPVSYNFKDLLPVDSDTITISRVELDEREEYTINIVVNADVMSQTNDLITLAPYAYVPFKLKLGESTDKILTFASDAVNLAKKQTGWEDVNDTNFDITKSTLGENVESNITYTISYSPKFYQVDLVGEVDSYRYGYNLTLPGHTDAALEYIYVINGDTENPYDEGQKVKVTGDLTISRTEQPVSAKEYLTSLLIKAGKITDEAELKVLQSDALNKGKSIRIQLPDGSAITAENQDDGTVKITVVPVSSKVGDTKWVADNGYLDVTTDTFSFVDGSYIVPVEKAKDFNKAYAIFKLALTPAALDITANELLDALNLTYDLKTDYTNQKNTLDKLAQELDTFAKMNDYPDQTYELVDGLGAMTFKELLITASGETGESFELSPATLEAAKTLAELIPEEGVLPFAETLKKYKDSSEADGMLDFYKNAQKTYLPQINQLYTIMETLVGDVQLMAMLESAGMDAQFKTARDLLAEAHKLNNQYAIDYERIDVASQSLASLLANIAASNPTKVETAPSQLELTEVVSKDAPGKYTVTVKVKFGEEKEYSWTAFENDVLDKAFVNNKIAELTAALNVPAAYYDAVVSDIPDKVTESVTISVYFVAKDYKVVVEGTADVLGYVSIEEPWLELPVNKEHEGEEYADGWYYTYTIGDKTVDVKEEPVDHDFTDVLPETGNTITISRVELDERPRYNVTIVVKGEVVNPATADDKTLVPLTTHTHTAQAFVIGTKWDEIAAYVASSGAEDAALALVDWKGVTTENYNRTYAGEVTVLTQDITYTITYRPMYKSVTFNGETQLLPYGYRLSLPEHPAVEEGQPDMEYVYTAETASGTTTHDQGTIYKVVEDVTITYKAQEATAKQYLTTLLVNTGTVTDSILTNAALIKGQSITIALPESKHLIVVSADGDQLITAELVNSRVGSLQWDADKGYLDVDNDGKYTQGVDEAFDFAEDNTYLAKKDYFKVFATYELPLTAEALKLSAEELLAVMNVPYELKTDYDNQKRVLDAILEQKPIFDMMNDVSAIEGLPEQFAGLTFKGVLNLASGSTGAQMGLSDTTRTKAAELAGQIPTGGELPFVGTLRNYESRGMIDFYQNEMTYRTQINELNDIMTILTADTELMKLIKQAGMEKAFTDAQTLLAEAYKLNDEYAINHDRINVSNANALATLLSDLGSETVRKQYKLEDVPAEMIWTQEVSAAAVGKVTVTVEGAIGDFPAAPAQIILNSGDPIDLDELNAIIEKMAAELGITDNAKHYDCVISEYPEAITEDLTITATWTAKEYGVYVEGVADALGTVTIDGGIVTLPAHSNSEFTYIYTIGDEKPAPGDFQFTPEKVDALVNADGKILITRLEVNAAENELTSKVNAMGATLLKDETGEYTVVLKLDANKLQDSLIQFVFGLILGSFDSVDMGGQPFYAEGQYHLQTMVDLIMNSGLDSETLLKMIDTNGNIVSDLFLPAANVLPATGEPVTGNVDLGAKVVTSTITLAYKAFNDQATSKTMKFYITLDGEAGDLVSARNAIETAQNKGITFELNGGFNANIDLNDEIYAAYVAALSMVGQADVDNLDELNARIAFGYLADHMNEALESTSVTTIKNTVGVDISAYEKYYNFFKSHYSPDLITYGEDDSKATVAFEAPINSILDKLQGTVDSMAASFGVSLDLASMIYEYKTGLNLATSVDLKNLDKHYVALAFCATKDIQSIACAMTAEDLKNVGNYNAVMLLADVTGNLNFTSPVVLDLNGMTVNGDITAEGKLIITDSNYAGNPGHVTGTVSGSDVTIVSGKFDTDVSEHLDGGYVQENGVVANKFFTTTGDGTNVTVTLNTTPDDLAELANKQGLIDMAMEIASGVLVNHYNVASLSIGGYKIYDIQLNDLVGMYKSENRADALIDTVLGCVSAADLADLVDEIIAQLTDFAGLEEKLNNGTEIMSFETATAPWNLEIAHIAKGDYLTFNVGAAEQKKTGSLKIVVSGAAVDELADLAGALADTVTEIESDFGVADIVRSGNNIVVKGTYNGAIEIDFRQHPEYVIMMAVILADGNDDIKADMVGGIKAYYATNKMSMSALEDAFDSLTVEDITTALANTGRNDSFMAKIKALGLSDIVNDSCFDDSALGYDLAIDLLGVLLRRYTPRISGTLGGLKKKDADKNNYYGLQGTKMVHRDGNRGVVAGYALDYDVTVTADYARLYLFPSELRVEDYEFSDKYITDALKEAEFNTVAAIENELHRIVTEELGAHANYALYEVQLEYFDVTTGKWVEATKEHFPVDKDGEYCLYVEMDVPTGADIKKDQFYVVHMFSENMTNQETGSVTEAGKVEMPEVTKHEDRNKISFFVTGLSPIMIGWTCDCTENGLVKYPAKDATCAEDGNTLYYHCPECDGYFSDADCLNKIAKDSWVIPAIGHDYGEPVWAWVGFTSATATFTCKNCGTNEFTVQPTYADEVQADGSTVRTWTATVVFDGKTYTDKKVETIPAPTPTDPTVGVPTVPKMPAEMLAFKVDATKGIIYVDLAADGITIEKMCEAVTAEVTNDADNKAEVTIKASKQTAGKLVTNGSVLTVTAENASGKKSGVYTIIVLGDTNSNGRTDSGDSFRIRMHYQEDLDLSKTWYELEAADINRNGRIESGDAVKNQVKYNDAANYKTHLK